MTVNRRDEAGRPLTPQQLHVLALIGAEGLSSVEVGERLGLAALTIKSHIAGAFRRTGARDRASLIAFAIRTRQLVWQGDELVPRSLGEGRAA